MNDTISSSTGVLPDRRPRWSRVAVKGWPLVASAAVLGSQVLLADLGPEYDGVALVPQSERPAAAWVQSGTTHDSGAGVDNLRARLFT